jgi:hypothetical protein
MIGSSVNRSSGGGVDARLIIVHEEVITSSSTWTRPAASAFNVSANAIAAFLEVDITAAGGGSGSGRKGTSTGNLAGGGSGAPGQRLRKKIAWEDVPSSVTCVVGAVGTGGAAQSTNATDGNPGTAGGNASFGDYLIAKGGIGGTGGGSATTTNGSTNTGYPSYNSDTGQIDSIPPNGQLLLGSSASDPGSSYMTPGPGGAGGGRQADANGGAIRAGSNGGRAMGLLRLGQIGGDKGPSTGSNGSAGDDGVDFGEPGDGGGGGYPSADGNGNSGSGGAGGNPGGGGGGGAAKNQSGGTGNSGAGAAGGIGKISLRIWGYAA